MLRKIRTKLGSLIAAAILAACSAIRSATPAVPITQKPLVIVVCGWNEKPGCSWTDPIVRMLRDKGYEVRQFAYDDAIYFDNTRPVIGIGFSYGGDTLCAYSAAGCRLDKLLLLNPVRQGNLWDQGKPLKVGKVGSVKIWATDDWFPNASRSVIDSAGNEFHAEMVPDATHSSLVPAVQEKIIDLF